MTFGVTPTGFVRKNFADIQASLFGYWKSKISRYLQLTEKTGLGNVGNGAADQLAEAWEAIEAAYYAGDPDNADDASQIAIAALTGTVQRGQTKGAVDVTLDFSTAGGVFPAGSLVSNVSGQPSNRWVLRDALTAPPGPQPIAGYPAVFISESPGAAAVAPAGTLVIAQPYPSWNSITNDLDATPGKDTESIEELSLRREVELKGSGSGTLSAVRAAVSKISGVISVQARQNVTNTAGVLPPKSYQICIYDGLAGAAASADVAQAIFAAGPAGIESIGSVVTQVAIGDDGSPEYRKFDRASQLSVYVTTAVRGTVAAADLKASIVAAGAKMSNGVTYAKLLAAIADTVGVNDVTTLTLGYSASPVGVANLSVAFGQIALFDVARIVVTVTP